MAFTSLHDDQAEEHLREIARGYVDMAETKSGVVRTFQTMEYSVFEAGMRHLGMTGGQLCTHLGYGSGSYHEWRKAGRIPYVAGVAIDAMQKIQSGSGSSTVLVSGSPRATATIVAVAEGMGLRVVQL